MRGRDEIIATIRKLAAIPRWDVLKARVANRFTTLEMVRAAGPGGESLDDLMKRTKPPVEEPLLAPHIEPYLQQPTRSGEPRRDNGVHRTRVQLERFVEYCGGEEMARLSDLTDTKINEFLRSLRNLRKKTEKVDPRTQNRYRAALSGLATYLRRERLIDFHPMRDGKVRKYKETHGERMPDWFGPAEYDKYMAAVTAYSPRAALLIELLAQTGIDHDEAHHIKVNELELRPRVSRLTARRKKIAGAKLRRIPVSATINPRVTAHIAKHKLKPRDLLFGMLKTTRSASSNLNCNEINAAHVAGRKAIGRGTAREGGDEHEHSFRLKDLRHVAAIAWARGGIPLERIQEYLGHATVHQTLVYAAYRPNDDEMAAAVRAVDVALRGK